MKFTAASLAFFLASSSVIADNAGLRGGSTNHRRTELQVRPVPGNECPCFNFGDLLGTFIDVPVEICNAPVDPETGMAMGALIAEDDTQEDLRACAGAACADVDPQHCEFRDDARGIDRVHSNITNEEQAVCTLNIQSFCSGFETRAGNTTAVPTATRNVTTSTFEPTTAPTWAPTTLESTPPSSAPTTMATPAQSTNGPGVTLAPSALPSPIGLEDLTATELGMEQLDLLEELYLGFGAGNCGEQDPPADLGVPAFIRFFVCQNDNYKAVARTTGNVQLGIEVFDFQDNNTVHQSFCTRAPIPPGGGTSGFSFDECTSRLNSFFATTPAPGTPPPSGTPSPVTPTLGPSTASPSTNATTAPRPAQKLSGHVFTMSNAQDGNQVLMFDRDMERGTLTFVGAFNTGGIGGSAQVPPSDPLASQDSVVLTTNGECVLAVNAGSDTLSSFVVADNKLVLAGVYNTSGAFPVSVQENGDVVYVLNAGGEGSISGFIKQERGCELTPIEGSTLSLNIVDGQNPPFFLVSPAQIGFTPDGSHLVVLEKGSSELGTITLYPVDYETGLLGEPVPTTSEGFTPFAFDFDTRGNLLVAEAFGDATRVPAVEGPTLNAGAVSTYQIHHATGELTPITSSEATLQTATCWVRHHNAESGCAYTTNNGNANSISSLRVDATTGEIELLQSVADTLDTPIDLSIVDDFLYVLSSGNGVDGQPSIHVYEITPSSCDIHLLEVLRDGIPSEVVTVFGAMGLAAI